MDFTYTVIFEPAEEGGYLAHIPTLNDATTQGETLEEARAMARDLIEGCIEAHIKLGRPIPVEQALPSSDGELMGPVTKEAVMSCHLRVPEGAHGVER